MHVPLAQVLLKLKKAGNGLKPVSSVSVKPELNENFHFMTYDITRYRLETNLWFIISSALAINTSLSVTLRRFGSARTATCNQSST